MREPKRVFVDMVGDLFHPGHLALLRAARVFCDQLVVGVCCPTQQSWRTSGDPS